jgi:hypothetical protein
MEIRNEMAHSVVVSADDGEVTLKEVVLKVRRWRRYLTSKWLTIIFFGMLGALGGLTYSYFQKPVYTATTTFVLEAGDKAGGLGQYAGLASIVGIDIGSGGGGGIFQGDNIIELYKSRTMIKKSLLSSVLVNGKDEMLVDRYIEFNNLRDKWKSDPQLRDLNFNIGASGPLTRVQDSLIGVFVSNINRYNLTVSKPDKELSIIRVDVKAKDELFAKAFNDQIVKNVNDFYIQTKTKKSLENVRILQQKTDSVKKSMNGAIYSAAAVADATPNLNPTRQVQRVVPMQRAQFSAETNKAVLGELVKNLEMSKMALMREMPLLQVVDTPYYPLMKEQFGKIKGLILGGLTGVLLTIIVLFLKKIGNSIMA